MHRHFVRFGIHADTNTLELAAKQGEYDAIVFNASMVEYTSSAIASLVTGRLSGVPFLIDPGTHAFAEIPSAIVPQDKVVTPDNVRQSIRGLTESYGLELGNPVGNAPLQPEHFGTLLTVDGFARNVARFQLETLGIALEEDAKYLEDTTKPTPFALISPYFQLTLHNYKAWLPIELELLERTRDYGKGLPIYGVILVAEDLLENEEAINYVIEAYLNAESFDGILLWVGGFNESTRSKRQLKSFIHLVRRMSVLEKPLINMYGGFFSVLCMNYGITGVSHGPGYGEHRDVVPVGGGPPSIRYYFTPIHQRVDYADVRTLIERGFWRSPKEFWKQVCDGFLCRQLLANGLKGFGAYGEQEPRRREDGTYDLVMTSETRERLKVHFIEAKQREMEEVARLNLSEIREALKTAAESYRPFFGSGSLEHLDTWEETITEV